jgi:hypothetical protein
MDSTAQRAKGQLWSGRVLSALAILFLTFDSVIKLLRLPAVAEASAKLGYQNDTIFNIGIVLLVCVILYAIPKTSILGAILLTGYLGGAVATHTRVGDPLFSHILFPTYVGTILWLGLYLREPRLRSLAPFRNWGDRLRKLGIPRSLGLRIACFHAGDRSRNGLSGTYLLKLQQLRV